MLDSTNICTYILVLWYTYNGTYYQRVSYAKACYIVNGGENMIHVGTKEIETERLNLRKFIGSDTNAAFKNWCSDDNVTKFLTWPTHVNLSITEAILKDWIKSYEKENFYQWAIVLKDTNELIGSISIVSIHDKTNSVEIGYCIGTNWWNKGFVSEAFSALITFMFEEMKVNRVEAHHDTNNPNSGKVMMKCGLKYEGTLRQSDFNNQGIVDASYYSILANEYFTDI